MESGIRFRDKVSDRRHHGRKGSIMSCQARWKEAGALKVVVMEGQKQVLDDHSDALASIASLANTYLSQGRWRRSRWSCWRRSGS